MSNFISELTPLAQKALRLLPDKSNFAAEIAKLEHRLNTSWSSSQVAVVLLFFSVISAFLGHVL